MNAKPRDSVNVQEMAIVCEHEHEHNLMGRNPVFYTPVHAQIVMTIWEDCHEIMEPEICVATPIAPVEHCVFDTEQINVIRVHDMELKSAHYSNVSINGQIVQVKQDTGAEVNMMSKSAFDSLSNSTTRTVLLKKTKELRSQGMVKTP